MNELRFGHRVIAWDDDKSKAVKGRYIYNGNGAAFPHCVLVRESNTHEPFNYCELDLEADEFLIGDEVEFSDYSDFKDSYTGAYVGIINTGQHVDSEGNFWEHCRYPRKEKDEAMELIEKLKEIGFSGSIHSECESYIFAAKSY